MAIDKNLIPKYVSTHTTYNIEGISQKVRVSSILSMANIGNNILDKWKHKRRIEKFASLASSFSKETFDTINWKDVFDKAYSDPDEYARESANFGTMLHDFLENYMNTGEFKELPQHSYAEPKICAESMKKFVTDWHLGPDTTFATELLIWSDVYNYAGCIDYVAQKDGKIYIFDWKTTSSLHTKYLLQLSAYWIALEERAKDYNLEFPIEHVYLVRFDKARPHYDVVDFGREQMLQYFEVFKSLLNVYSFSKNVVLNV